MSFFKKNIFGFHIAIIISLIVAFILAFKKLSNLDLFDFFSVIYSAINMAFLFHIIITYILFILGFYVFSRVRKTDKKQLQNLEKTVNLTEKNLEINQKNLEIAENNRLEIKIFLEDLITNVNDLKLIIKNEVINHKELIYKLQEVVNSIYTKRKYKLENADFYSFCNSLIIKISDTYSLFKKTKDVLKHDSIETLKREFANMIIADRLKVDIDSINNLVSTLLHDFNFRKYNTKESSENIILENTKILLTEIYRQHISENENDMQLQSSHLTFKNSKVENLIKEYENMLILENDPIKIEKYNTEINRLTQLKDFQ